MSIDNVAGLPADDEEDMAALLSQQMDLDEGIAPQSYDDPDDNTVAETAEEAATRARDENGRFAKAAEAHKEAEAATEAKAPADAVAQPDADQHAAPIVRPPPGWSPASKVAFDALPDSVKADIAKREQEVNQGFAKLSEYKPLEPFADLARQNGTTLAAAVQNYRNLEVQLQQDFQGGVDLICGRFGVHPVALANSILARHGSAPNQQGETGAVPAYQTANGPDLTPIKQELETLKNYIATQQSQTVQSTIAEFAADPAHTFFDNVRPQMAALMQSGQAKDLKEAYDAACWMNPEIRTLLIKQQSMNGSVGVAGKAAAATQARSAAKSITGSPTPGAAGSRAPSRSLEDEIRANWDANSV
jgi:hypothetical protein